VRDEYDFILPGGLTIVAIHGDHSYDSLYLIAKSKCLMGSGFDTTFLTKFRVFINNQLLAIDI